MCLPFDGIRKANTEHLKTLLSREHPQTIALVLSNLDYEKASKVLSSFDIDFQTEISRRLIQIDTVLPEVVRDIEAVLERSLSRMTAPEDTIDGVGVFTEIINSGEGKEILERLAAKEPALVKEIKERIDALQDYNE